jgi:hypothetical protein
MTGERLLLINLWARRRIAARAWLIQRFVKELIEVQI